MNQRIRKEITASIIAVGFVLSAFAAGNIQGTQFASATTIEGSEPPVNTEQSVYDTHNAIIASLDSTEDVPDEFNVRWTQPGTVESDNGVSLFVVDCLPGEYPGNEQFMGAEGVEIINQFVIGSGEDYLSTLFLVVNTGDEDQIVKLGTTCIDEEGGESGDDDTDVSSTTRISNNLIVNNIVYNIVKNIQKNITIINNSTNGTVVTPPPGNTTDPGDNTTDPGGNTTDPGTGPIGNTTDPGTGPIANTTEVAPGSAGGAEEPTETPVTNTTTPTTPTQQGPTSQLNDNSPEPVPDNIPRGTGTPPVVTVPDTEIETVPESQETTEEEETPSSSTEEEEQPSGNIEETTEETDNNDNTADATTEEETTTSSDATDSEDDA
jgi:hypothetical protein